MAAAIGDAKDYSLKRYMVFVEKLQTKAKVGSIIPFLNTLRSKK